MCFGFDGNAPPNTQKTEERGRGEQVAHYHLKRHALKWVAVNRAVFDKVKWVLFYMTIEEFWPKYSMLQTFHEEPKESYQLMENGHQMSPLKYYLLTRIRPRISFTVLFLVHF